MTKNETEALLAYLNFSLETLCTEMEQFIPNDAVGIMYDKTYGVLEDLQPVSYTHLTLPTSDLV